MPEFKDISTFNSVVPVGTEKIQVSAANCVTLMGIANLGSKTEWYSNLDKRITQNREDALANYELANQANNKAVEAMGDAETALGGVSAIGSQIASIAKGYKALSSYNNITGSSSTMVLLIGNKVYFINDTLTKTILLDINRWGESPGSLQDSVIYIPRRNGVGGIVEWSTPNKVSGIYGNLTEVEMMVSSLNRCLVRYQVSLVKSENGNGMSGFELIIIGTVLLSNPNKEVMDQNIL